MPTRTPAPVRPAERWAPYGVSRLPLGDRTGTPGGVGHDSIARDVDRAVRKLIKEGA